MGLSHSPSIVTNGLVLAMDAANIKSYPGSGTVWNDLSGNGNTGTLTNGPTYNSANGGSIVFDGVNDIVTTETLPYQFLNTGATFTVGFRYNLLTSNDNLISWGNSAFNGGTSASMEIRIRGAGSVEFAPGVLVGAEAAPRRTSYVPSPALNGRDVILTVTYTPNGNAIIYENGVQKAITDYSGVGTYTNTQLLRIGRGSDTNFPGNIYFVNIHNRALSATEVQQNFNAFRGRYGI